MTKNSVVTGGKGVRLHLTETGNPSGRPLLFIHGFSQCSLAWTRQMESAFDAFARHEERLGALSLRPSEYVRRQVRATPYPTEDVGWIIEQSGPEVCLFSSDYPHVEGGRRPIERFEASLGDAGDAVRDAFYAGNFLDLMGTAGATLAA